MKFFQTGAADGFKAMQLEIVTEAWHCVACGQLVCGDLRLERHPPM